MNFARKRSIAVLGLGVAAVMAVIFTLLPSPAGAQAPNDCFHPTTITHDVVLEDEQWVEHGDCKSQAAGRAEHYSRYYNIRLDRGETVTIEATARTDTVFYLRYGENVTTPERTSYILSGRTEFHTNEVEFNDDGGVGYNAKLSYGPTHSLVPSNPNSQINGRSAHGHYTLEVTTYSPGYHGARFNLAFSGIGEPDPELSNQSDEDRAYCGTNIPRGSGRTADNKPPRWIDSVCGPWVNDTPEPDFTGCSAADWDAVDWRNNPGLRPTRNTAGTTSCPPPGHEPPPNRSPGSDTPRTLTDDERAEKVEEIEAAIARYRAQGNSMTGQATWMLQNIVEAIRESTWDEAKGWCYRYADFGAYLKRWDEVEDMRAYYATFTDAVEVEEIPIPHQDLVPDTEDWYGWCQCIPQVQVGLQQQQHEPPQQPEYRGGLVDGFGYSETAVLESRIQGRIQRAIARSDRHSENLWRRALATVRGVDPPNGLAVLPASTAYRISGNHHRAGRTELADLWRDIGDAIGG